MKNMKKIITWTLASVILQLSVLAYFNFFFLERKGEAKATLINPVTQQAVEKKSVEVANGAENVTVSSDKSLVAYKNGNNIEIKNIKDGTIAKTIDAEDRNISAFKWLPDRNILIYALNNHEGQSGKASVHTYNADTDDTHGYPDITGLPSNSHITDIELSPLTNMVYVKIDTGRDTAKIYKYDVMSRLYFVMNSNINADIRELVYESKLAYTDGENRLFIYDSISGSKKQLETGSKVKLLGIAGKDDEIYAGVLDNEGNVTEIRVGKYTDSFGDWKNISLKSPAKPEALKVTADGKLYQANIDGKTVTNIETGNKTALEGTLAQLDNGTVITVNSNKAFINELK